MVSPNSSNVPCRALICAVRNFTSYLRERCRTSIDCCSSVLTAISLPGCCTAIQIARASITSFLLPMTNALTKRACNNRTLCPCFVNSRAQYWEPPHFSCHPRLHTQIVERRSLHSPMTSLKTSIKAITYLSDIGCLEIQGASLLYKIATSFISNLTQ